MILEHVHIIKRSNSKNPLGSKGEDVVHKSIGLVDFFLPKDVVQFR